MKKLKLKSQFFRLVIALLFFQSYSVIGNNSTIPLNCETNDILEIANIITDDYGIIMDYHAGTSGKKIFVFEESHASISGQIEMSIMLNKLVQDYGINEIGLEGALYSEGNLKAEWFQKFKNKNESSLSGTAVSLLQEGEISAAEFITLVYPQAKVFGVEDEEQYKVSIPDNSQAYLFIALIEIAKKSADSTQINDFEKLFEKGEIEEAMEFITGFDPFTKNAYQDFKEREINSTEAYAQRFRNIKKEIESRDSLLDAFTALLSSQAIDDLIKFYDVATQRSETISLNTLSKISESGILITGAAHTDKVKEVLEAGKHTYVVIRNNTLSLWENGTIETRFSNYSRKVELLSVDTSFFGKLISNEKKPKPVIAEVWFQSKAEMNLGVSFIMDRFSGGEYLPFDDDFKKQLNEFKNVRFNQNSFERIGNDFICQVSIKTNDGTWEDLWVRSGQVLEDVSQVEDLDQQLKTALAIVKQRNNIPDVKIQHKVVMNKKSIKKKPSKKEQKKIKKAAEKKAEKKQEIKKKAENIAKKQEDIKTKNKVEPSKVTYQMSSQKYMSALSKDKETVFKLRITS